VTGERTVAVEPTKKSLDPAGKAKAPKPTRAERELDYPIDAELRRAVGIESPKAPTQSRGPKR
jgi:hypothetical protein